MTISPNRRSTKRGRPRVIGEQFRCSRCERMANQRRASWPGEDLCYSCFYAAMRTRGICPGCGHNGMLPGLAIDADRQPICLSCAGIPADFTCRRCGAEGDFYRRGTCARCALRDDLAVSMIDGAHDPQAMAAIVEALCRVERPAPPPPRPETKRTGARGSGGGGGGGGGGGRPFPPIGPSTTSVPTSRPT